MTTGGRLAAIGILLTGVLLLAVRALDRSLSLPPASAKLATAAAVMIRRREAPWRLLGSISWTVLPLVAGLFVLGEALRFAPVGTGAVAGIVLALLCNLMNNLPAGLIAGPRWRRRIVRVVTNALLVNVGLWSEPVGHRFARHHPVANRAAPRGAGGRLRPLPVARRPGHAACPVARLRRPSRAPIGPVQLSGQTWSCRKLPAPMTFTTRLLLRERPSQCSDARSSLVLGERRQLDDHVDLATQGNGVLGLPPQNSPLRGAMLDDSAGSELHIEMLLVAVDGETGVCDINDKVSARDRQCVRGKRDAYEEIGEPWENLLAWPAETT